MYELASEGRLVELYSKKHHRRSMTDSGGSTQQDSLVNTSVTLVIFCILVYIYIYRPFRAFIRAFGKWSAQQPPIFVYCIRKIDVFLKKNGKIFLGGHRRKGPISNVKN